MKQSTLTFLLTFFLTGAFSQALKTVKIKYPAPISTKEIFEVLKDKPSIKNGCYKKLKSKNLIESGYYKDNKKDSTWKIFSSGGQLIATGNYASDTLAGIWSYYSINGVLIQKYDHEKDSLIYFDVKEEKKIGPAPAIYPDTAQETMPIFIGGTTYMHTLIENNVIYPKEAWQKSKSASGYISFVVDTSGNTTQVKSIEHMGDGFDEAGIKLIESFGRSWIPGIQRGKKVRVHFKLPLNFKLE